MRLLRIATLVALAATASALPPRRGDVRPGRSLETRAEMITVENLKELVGKLGDKGKEFMQNLEVACEAYTHAKDASHPKRRGIFENKVRLDARDPTITEAEAKKWEDRAKAIIKTAEAACEAYTHSKDAGHLQQRGNAGRLHARGLNIDVEKLKKLGDQAKKIITSAEAAYAAYNHARDLSYLQKRGIFGDPGKLDARDKPVTIGDLAKLPGRVQKAIEDIKSGQINDLSTLMQRVALWNYEDHHGMPPPPSPGQLVPPPPPPPPPSA
jgi:hypothetical protein